MNAGLGLQHRKLSLAMFNYVNASIKNFTKILRQFFTG